MNRLPVHRYTERITEAQDLMKSLQEGDDLNNDRVILKLRPIKEFFK